MSILRFTKMSLLFLFCVLGGVNAQAQATVEDLINQEATGVEGTTYKDASVTGNSGAVYAIHCAGGEKSVQLRTKKTDGKSYSGIVTTKSGGKAKKVTVVWNSKTLEDRTLDIYGRSEAYKSPNDLFASDKETKGTKIGSIKMGESTELDITEDYAFIGLRSNDAAMYLTSITITWEKEGGVTEDVTVNLADGFATLYNQHALTVPENATCGIVTEVKNGALTIDYKYDAGKTIPARTPVLVKADGKEHVTFAIAKSEEAAPAHNLLKGADKDGEITAEEGEYYYYKLAYGDYTQKTGLGFYWGAEQGGVFTMKAGKAYLAVAQTQAQGAQKLSLEGNATGIEAVEEADETNRTVYTLDGRRVMNAKLTKGLYIINGKKVIVK